MTETYDVVVVGGGPVGLATAYESAKAGKKVLLLEQYNLFNQSGSSGDLVRMFRTMYTEDYLADLALQAHDAWTDLEKDSAERLVWMTGLLNFGDPNASGAEGTLLGPIPNLERHKMSYRRLTNAQIMSEFPFTNLPANYEGLYGDLNGCINVPLTLRTLHRLAMQYGGKVTQYAQVTKITKNQSGGGTTVTYTNTQDNSTHTISAKKVAITGGAYVNHVLRPSFNFELDLNIWEMVYSYFSVNPGPNGTLLPSMWFQFAENAEEGQPSNMFYGFPALPWGVQNTIRVAVDSAVRTISDPYERTVSPAHKILQHTSDWVKTHIKGANPIPNFTGNCLQTNVIDNNFVLDFIPDTNNDVVIFTAGWAMKFVPLLGKILTELMVDGKTQYDISNFKITREGIIKKQAHVINTTMISEFLIGSISRSAHGDSLGNETVLGKDDYSSNGSGDEGTYTEDTDEAISESDGDEASSESNGDESECERKEIQHKDGTTILTNANLNIILWWLINHCDYSDPILIKTLLHLCLKFTTAPILFQNLMQIFNFETPAPKVISLRHSLNNIRKRVAGFIRIWIEFFFDRDFYTNKSLFSELISFLDQLKNNTLQHDANVLKLVIIRVNKRKIKGMSRFHALMPSQQKLIYALSPGKTHFLGGKYAPSAYSRYGRPDKLTPIVGSSTPVKVEKMETKPNTAKSARLFSHAVPAHQHPKTNRAALIHSLLHAKAVPHPDATHVPAVAQPLGTRAQDLNSAHHVIKKQYRETLVTSPSLRATHTASAAPLGPLDKTPLKVGIVGGGMAGLYAAMILKDLGIDFTVFEASTERWGGRVYTYHFPELAQQGYNGVYDYVDFGAMRFPHIPSMQRTFDLFDMVGLDAKHREKYILSDDNNLLYYNGVRLTRTEYSEALKKDTDPLHFAERNGGGVPDRFVDIGADEILDKAFGPILADLNKDFNTGFTELMQKDGFSTRAFLNEYVGRQRTKTQDNVNVVNWLETLNTASGLYDEAFSESIMDALDFQDTDAEGDEVQWYCITGGTEKLVKAMVNEKLKGANLLAGHEVTKIAPSESGHGVTLTMRTEKQEVVRPFDHVICTVPLSILRQIDLSKCDLGYHKRTAMHIMHYDHSTQVALVFKTRWWQKLKKPIFGGQSSTDLFIRTVVYPSQGIQEPNAPGILLISYSWSQDASRMAAICLRDDLADRCLENLAVLHDIPLQELKEQYLNVVKYVDWHREPFMDGAFPLFGPGQFVASFQGAITPEVHGHLHFAGEALSVHHAWIIGSLNSAYRTVHEILAKENMAEKIKELKARWGEIDAVEYGGVDLDEFVNNNFERHPHHHHDK